MAKLYPPQIEGALPAFYGKVLTVPFMMNKTVSKNEVAGFQIKIKSIQNNKIVYTAAQKSSQYFDLENLMQVEFNINTSQTDLEIGASYKVQLAYIHQNGEIGYYSTVGVVKYTAAPQVTIGGLVHGELNINNNEYYGLYNQKNGDQTEKLYSYIFNVYDQHGALYDTSGEQVHNHENDEEVYLSKDRFVLNKSLEDNKIYTIQYSGTTINNMKVNSPKYRITQKTTIPPEIYATLYATMNSENGYVNLQIIGDPDEAGHEQTATGTYLISRSSSEDGFTNWSEICRFVMFGDKPSLHSWKDFTVEHGVTYRYSLQQYNEKYSIYSNRMYSNDIEAAFEHAFLYDGFRQLKIKFNPKVTSFKETLLEQKTNTLGGKYPHFFRNGNVSYKEFPISGLVSYHSDDEQLFLTNEEMLLDDYSKLKREHTLSSNVTSEDYEYFNNMVDMNYSYRLQSEYQKREGNGSQENKIINQRGKTTNLTDYNILAERIFKLKVLEFLNNGKPKLFRSPGEGNYVVRLMNSSLTPDDKLNRMLHTFNTTATEIDNSDYNTLNKYGFINIDEPDTKQLRWKTIDIREFVLASKEGWISRDSMEDWDAYGWESIGAENNIQMFRCVDMAPGDRILIEEAGSDEPQIIQIGVTGAYEVVFDAIPKRVCVSRTSRQGQITYGYYGSSMHHFDTYRDIKIDNMPVTQIIGSTNGDDLANMFKDNKHIIVEYNFINFTKRPVIDVVYQNGQYYINGHRLDSLTEMQDLTDSYIYRVNGTTYYDGREHIGDNPIDYSCKIYIDDKEVDLTEIDDYQLKYFTHIPKIVTTSGVLTDISLQRREIVYDVEYQDVSAYVYNKKRAYLNALEKTQRYIKYNDEEWIVTNENSDGSASLVDSTTYEQHLAELKNEVKTAYQVFLEAVEKTLKEKEVLG